MRLRHSLSALVIVISVLAADTAKAQISLTAGLNQYTQDFNTLSSGPTTTSAYTDNSTIPGFYALVGRIPLGTPVGTSTDTYTPAIYNVMDGTTVTTGIADLGSSGSTNRAFGTFVTDGATAVNTGFMTYGFRFVNNDPIHAITSFTVQYTGEQWRRVNTNNQTLAFSSAVFDSGKGGLDPVTGYTSNTDLDFISRGNSIQVGTRANYTDLKTGTITATVRPGQELWIRWVDVNDPGDQSDHVTAIDNVSVNATFDPTPAPPGYISGLIGSAIGFAQFGVVRLRKRRRLRKQ